MLTVTALDHIVLVADDVDKTLAWYCEELGLEGIKVEEWRRGEAPFPSARVNADTILDFIPRKGASETGVRNLDHLCLVIEPTDLDELAASGRFEVVSGPGRRSGARGEGTSLYVVDPDRTVVELRHYGHSSDAVR